MIEIHADAIHYINNIFRDIKEKANILVVGKLDTRCKHTLHQAIENKIGMFITANPINSSGIDMLYKLHPKSHVIYFVEDISIVSKKQMDNIDYIFASPTYNDLYSIGKYFSYQSIYSYNGDVKASYDFMSNALNKQKELYLKNKYEAYFIGLYIDHASNIIDNNIIDVNKYITYAQKCVDEIIDASNKELTEILFKNLTESNNCEYANKLKKELISKGYIISEYTDSEIYRYSFTIRWKHKYESYDSYKKEALLMIQKAKEQNAKFARILNYNKTDTAILKNILDNEGYFIADKPHCEYFDVYFEKFNPRITFSYYQYKKDCINQIDEYIKMGRLYMEMPNLTSVSQCIYAKELKDFLKTMGHGINECDGGLGFTIRICYNSIPKISDIKKQSRENQHKIKKVQATGTVDPVVYNKYKQMCIREIYRMSHEGKYCANFDATDTGVYKTDKNYVTHQIKLIEELTVKGYKISTHDRTEFNGFWIMWDHTF